MHELTPEYIESLVRESLEWFVVYNQTLHCFETLNEYELWRGNNPQAAIWKDRAIQSFEFIAVCDAFEGQYAVARHYANP